MINDKRYIVEMRPPKEGEEFIANGKIWIAQSDYRSTRVHPVIIKVVTK